MTLRAVVFDYGHTFLSFGLADEHLLACYEEIRRMLEVQAYRDLPDAAVLVRDVSRHIEQQVEESYTNRDLAEVDLIALFERRLAGYGWKLSRDKVQQIVEMEHRTLSRDLAVADENLEVLRCLRHRGLKIGLVSNAHFLPNMMRDDIERLGIARLVDEAVFSSEIGIRKPHPQIFLSVLDALDVRPEEAVFIGDRLRDDLAGAKSLGMRGVLTRQYRYEELDSYPVAPDLVVERLPDILPYIDHLLQEDRQISTPD